MTRISKLFINLSDVAATHWAKTINKGDSVGVLNYLKGQGLRSPAEMKEAFERLVVGLGMGGATLMLDQVSKIQKGLGEIETDPDRPLPADEDVKERAGEVFRGLRAAGYQDRSIIKLAAELISLLTEDLRDKE